MCMPIISDMPVQANLVALRSPDTVNQLARMGAFHPTRLSFMQTLLRRIKREAWTFERPVWDIDARGVGRAVYTVHGPVRSYSLVAFAHDLLPEMRSDRVIATAWDATFTLFDGVPTQADLERLQDNVPRQEAGRISETELTLARANRSVRLWEHVVERLSAGEQPDSVLVSSIGYVMRTTAVYGSGKFGAADRLAIAQREELKAPFSAEMLTVWLIRAFTLDLVEHLARLKGGESAVVIAPALRRSIGVGNSTGLGMAPFLLNHPVLFHRWMLARETALARVRSLKQAGAAEQAAFTAALQAAQSNAASWSSEHPVQVQKLTALRGDLLRLALAVERGALRAQMPWETLYRWAEVELSLEGQEQLVSLMMEPYAELVDDLSDEMDADELAHFTIQGNMTLQHLHALLQTDFSWAQDIDFADPKARSRFWYVSEEKLEPRLGDRHSDTGAELELPLCTADAVQAMRRDLAPWHASGTVADFLLKHPEHRHAMRRVQMVHENPYAEVRDNLLAADMLPIDLLRCKLSFFGATHFDPRSDCWVRISMYQDAPFPSELCESAQPGQHTPCARQADQATHLRCTLSEIETLSRKAARGAGLSWGLADEASKAARWLASVNLPGPMALAQLLDHNDGKPFTDLCPIQPSWIWLARGGEMCPLIAGASLLDRACSTLEQQAQVSLGALTYPILILPFLARAAAQAHTGFEASWSGLTVSVQVDGLTVHGDIRQLNASRVDGMLVRRIPVLHAPALQPSVSSQLVDPAAWSVLERFGRRTLVPATERSRAGAGSSTTDND